MINAFERTVAFRYLRSRRQEGFISVTAGFSLLGICLGVGALIIVMSVMNGFRHELITRILGFNGHVTVVGSGGFNVGNYDELAIRLEEVDGVLTATPMIEGQVLATSPNAQSGALVRGVTREDLEQQTLIADSIKAGKIENFGEIPGVVVGARLLSKLGLTYGDNITLISPKGIPTAFGTVPRSVAYQVIGVFEVGMYEFDSSVIFMPLDQAQIYFRLDDAVTQIELNIDTPESPLARSPSSPRKSPTRSRSSTGSRPTGISMVRCRSSAT